MGALELERQSTDTYSRYINLPPDPLSAGEARHWLDDVFNELGHPLGADREYFAGVAFSELVTNAVVHAGTWFRGLVTHTSELLTIGVIDYAPATVPRPRQPSEDQFEDSGRGMEVVKGCCDDLEVKIGAREREKAVLAHFKV